MLRAIRRFLSRRPIGTVERRIERLVKQTSIPVFWLFGKTQSGKTSIIKFLTGADDAEIGQGFKPCTRFAREYRFPAAETPLLIFLDTRGLEEPGYDAAEDLARFDAQAHVVIVTIRVLDFASERLLEQLQTIRRHRPSRPVVLAMTCLHEAYPQQQHVEPFPFRDGAQVDEALRDQVPENLLRGVDEQLRRFRGLFDHAAPIDFTPIAEGFRDSSYGGAHFKETLIEALPEAYRQTLLKLDEATRSLQNLMERRALPHIIAYSSLAATAGAVPIPWVDLLVLPGIQTQMVFHLAKLYGQPLSGPRFLELAGALGMGMLVRQGIREFAKLIPIVGSVAGATLAGSATFALGKAFCYYYRAVYEGHVPNAEDLKRYYHEQLSQAKMLWSAS